MSAYVNAPHDGATMTKVRPNRYAGKGACCGQWIKAGEGQLAGSFGHWEIRHIVACPVAAEVKPATVTATPGVYQLGGKIYVVKPTKTPGRVFARELVESAPRMTEAGTVIPFDLVPARGIVWYLKPEHRLTLADANEISARYGKCLCCTRALYAADTIKKCVDTGQWVGPVCRKTYFG